jgi:para-aminobenzoate synthetase component 1
MRKIQKTVLIPNYETLKKLQDFYGVITFLNSNNSTVKSLLAVGVIDELKYKESVFFEDLKNFIDTHNDWVFGYFNYDLKNTVEPKLSSNNNDFIQMNKNHFFVPKLVVEFENNEALIHYNNDASLIEFKEVLNSSFTDDKNESISIFQRETKQEYIYKIKTVKEHIQLGDIYEMNYCHEFYANNISINNPAAKYSQLNEKSNAPFSVYYKNKKQYILSASPERFLKKEGDTITSQPIKGTAKRGATKEEDLAIKTILENDPKERSENIMIVDLVRNDLSKTALKGSVKVEELCKVYTFDTVHQMISTVTSKIDLNTHPVEVIKNAYPMGSMTGAPKIGAMKIIEELEETKRGIYSGAIGYFSPEKDFDFNVVIRTILYNEELNRLSFMVGGAITLKSDPEKEYEETLLKANVLLKTLNNE